MILHGLKNVLILINYPQFSAYWGFWNKTSRYVIVIRNWLNKENITVDILLHNLFRYHLLPHSKGRRQPGRLKQRRALGAVEGLKKRDHTSDTLLKYKALKVVDVNTLICETFVHKSMNDLTLIIINLISFCYLFSVINPH